MHHPHGAAVHCRRLTTADSVLPAQVEMISIPMNPEPRVVLLKYLMDDPLSLARLSDELVYFFSNKEDPSGRIQSGLC